MTQTRIGPSDAVVEVIEVDWGKEVGKIEWIFQFLLWSVLLGYRCETEA